MKKILTILLFAILILYISGCNGDLLQESKQSDNLDNTQEYIDIEEDNTVNKNEEVVTTHYDKIFQYLQKEAEVNCIPQST